MKSLKEVTGQIVSVVWHYCQRFSLRCWGKVFQWLSKDWHKKVSDFCKMKFVHVHVRAADWMNTFPNRGRYHGRWWQIASIISWQNSLYCSQLSTSSVKVNCRIQNVLTFLYLILKSTKWSTQSCELSLHTCLQWKGIYKH